ncbi:MAG: phosphatidylserine/phosphatidylglycerophosphate/cardiolipin synthase family protein [Saprospiraceae bacterium]|nr:phosphatidylserine/phosphatidylglycerophosphate/cardiolipin synthase family protein [Saprospiraceae bacterium]
MSGNVTYNNSIELLPSGKQSYAKRWALIENAKESIHIVTFSFMKDGTTKKLFELLRSKAQAGVKIRIIYDDIVNRTTFMTSTLHKLRDSGIEVFGYNPLWEGWSIDWSKGKPFKQIAFTIKLKLKQHFHEKYMIVDNKHAILGGINWGDKYAFGGIEPKAWRDSDVYLEGDCVSPIQLQFLKDYKMQHAWKNRTKSDYRSYIEFCEAYRSVYVNDQYHQDLFPEYFHQVQIHPNAKPVAVQYRAHKPYDLAKLDLTDFFLEKISKAQKRIYWGCHGIRPPKIFAEYFVQAVKRGVKVVLITNSEKSSKTLMLNGLLGWMYAECTKHFKYLLENGVEIYEWQRPGAFHSKNLVIDDEFSSIGSYNIANGSAFHHSESNVVVMDKEFCEIVFSQFEEDLQHCSKVKLNEFHFPKQNAYDRIIHERNKLIGRNLWTPSIEADILNNRYKAFPLYEFIDMS